LLTATAEVRMENLKTVRQILKNTEPAVFWQCSCTA